MKGPQVVLVPLAGGRATLRHREVEHASWWDCRELAAGSRAAVEAAARLLVGDAWQEATCISPNGRLDGHYNFVTRDGEGVTVCSFCGRRQADGGFRLVQDRVTR